jgi:hypothetical protein
MKVVVSDFGLQNESRNTISRLKKLVSEDFNNELCCNHVHRPAGCDSGKKLYAYTPRGSKDKAKFALLLKLGDLVGGGGRLSMEILNEITHPMLDPWPAHQRSWAKCGPNAKRNIIDDILPALVSHGYVEKAGGVEEDRGEEGVLVPAQLFPDDVSSSAGFAREVSRWSALIAALRGDIFLPVEVAVMEKAMLDPANDHLHWRSLGERLGALKNPIRTNRSLPCGVDGAEHQFLKVCKDLNRFYQNPDGTRGTARLRECRVQLKTALKQYGLRMSAAVCSTLGVRLGHGSIFELKDGGDFLEYLSRHTERLHNNNTALCLSKDYDEKDYAMLQAICVDNAISGRKFGAVFAGFFLFFKKRLPTVNELISRRKLSAHFLRLQAFESSMVKDEVMSLDEEGGPPTWSLGYMTDCSNNGEERLVSYFTFPHPDGSGPKAVFTGIGPVYDKTDPVTSQVCGL